MLRRALLFGVILALLIAAPAFSSQLTSVFSTSETLTLPANASIEAPFSVPETSNVSITFSSSEPVEAFVLSPAQNAELSYKGPMNFEIASGNVKSASLIGVLSSGTYYIAFFNYGNLSATLTYSTPILTLPGTLRAPTSTEMILPRNLAFTLSPGEYLAVKMLVPQNSSLVQAYFELTIPRQNAFNYYPFDTVSYLISASRFADFLRSATNFSSIYSSESGFFLNVLHTPVQAGEYYFVTFDSSATQSVNVSIPDGFNLTSPESSVEQASAEVQTGRLEYLINFTSSGDTYYVPFAVSFNGHSQKSAASMLFLERNGTYPWSITSVDGTSSLSISSNKTVAAGFLISPVAGQLRVDGQAVNVVINFQLVLYSITFVETGLPSGTSWSVSMNLTTLSSTTNKIAFELPNYTAYGYTVSPPQGYTALPSSGSVPLEGINQTIDITFTSESNSSTR